LFGPYNWVPVHTCSYYTYASMSNNHQQYSMHTIHTIIFIQIHLNRLSRKLPDQST
jgi:hypothetical protein